MSDFTDPSSPLLQMSEFGLLPKVADIINERPLKDGTFCPDNVLFASSTIVYHSVFKQYLTMYYRGNYLPSNIIAV